MQSPRSSENISLYPLDALQGTRQPLSQHPAPAVRDWFAVRTVVMAVHFMRAYADVAGNAPCKSAPFLQVSALTVSFLFE